MRQGVVWARTTRMTVRLMSLVQGGGRARKLPAESLVQVLNQLPPPTAAHPWVDDSTGPLDDAAIVRPDLHPDEASDWGFVMTIDVVTPMVDDRETFGAIAAANSLSDVYAMGGEPNDTDGAETGEENCGSMGTGGGWIDAGCATSYRYVCEL